MTDKEIEEKREEFITTFPSLYEGLGTGSYLEIHDKVWQWIEELIRHYHTQGKIEGYKECLEEQDEHGKYNLLKDKR
ncbi:MAG TPA: hypothetical protein PKU78_03395 [Candidatus Dojkabacteria bacterium]|nr:hypothetical protein [Candidatus Dojkabacteria bacterium]HRO65240.1 hypothetical protein [Candidatus Dojkabacteria bacterium]HRP37869.1 hypothetical protein [Candidatus Dojkabacteria bacterium]HRP50794.1 hypothetical protein [Candidatus Dojkabacteria bacterium]